MLDSFHVYRDQTGFEYEVVMTMISLFDKIKLEKYTLYVRPILERYCIFSKANIPQIFESNAFPKLYKWGAKYNRGREKASFYREGCVIETYFDKAFLEFRNFFKNKTGIEWDQRCDGIIDDDATKFRYTLPEDGKPLGVLPPGYMRPKPLWEIEEEAQDEDMEDADATGDGESDSDRSTVTLKDEVVERTRPKTPTPSVLDYPYRFAAQAS